MGAHPEKVCGESELAAFKRYQEKARREYAISGILFDFHVVEGAYLRTQDTQRSLRSFLAPKMINLLSPIRFGYDIDRDRTGGCSIGPRPRRPGFAGDLFYKSGDGNSCSRRSRHGSKPKITSYRTGLLQIRDAVDAGPIEQPPVRSLSMSYPSVSVTRG